VALLGACGQTGKLYLPQSEGEVVTRPTQTPPPDVSPESGKSSNSPQTVDSPRSTDTPAPEVSAPAGDPGEKDKKDGAQSPPPPSQPRN
jgi:hypothetical protein